MWQLSTQVKVSRKSYIPHFMQHLTQHVFAIRGPVFFEAYLLGIGRQPFGFHAAYVKKQRLPRIAYMSWVVIVFSLIHKNVYT